MSDKSDDIPFANLEPLDDSPKKAELEPLAELEPMTELEPIVELEPEPETPEPEPEPVAADPEPEPVVEEVIEEVKEKVAPVAAAAAAAAGAAAGAAAAAPKAPRAGGKSSGGGRKDALPDGPIKPVLGQKRELEATPLMLRKAAKILFIGALFPWLVALKADPEVPVAWVMLYAAKAVTLIGTFLIHQGVIAGYGGEVKGFVAPLAKAHKTIPTFLGLAIALGSIALVVDQPGIDVLAAAGEIMTLILAAWTFSHIHGYEYGARFNPIFPVMFSGPAIAGALSVFGAAALFGKAPALAGIGLLGCLLVAAGGCMAIYSLFLAMKQAKIEGEEKKRLMMEHRKAQRAAKRAAQQAEQAGS